ncbi:hypothetical protein GCM10009764_79030 [Nocardia ninae]|uniref:Uncharacterized protein n=1 Tax=Nocardia ninae NBRC 108245 TaxID=1210091 RepID=A0A511MT34_9NOCA|nr:hypothetical protein NN4_78660 [Nocardia ninae NBRC 108245]
MPQQPDNPHADDSIGNSNCDPVLACQCCPPRRIEADQMTIDRGTIVCGICVQPFTTEAGSGA